jgi:hypothetical protein
MKAALKTCLLLSCLLGAAALPAAARADHSGHPRLPFVRPSPAAPAVLEHIFTGYGDTDKDAEENALEQARSWLADQGDFGKAGVEYLKRHKMVQQLGKPSTENLPVSGKLKKVEVQLRVTHAQADELYRIGREERMRPRHLLFARLLGGFLALVLVCGGYLRLEEATRGYYTLLLRAAAVALLLLVGAGLWLAV